MYKKALAITKNIIYNVSIVSKERKMMLTQRQVKEVVKLLKSKDLNYRPAFQQVFESGGYMWATDGYVTFELFKCDASTLGKCAGLNTLQRWLATSNNKDLFSDWEDLSDAMPDMCNIVHGEFIPSVEIKLDIKKLKQCCDFLKTTQFTINTSSKNHHLHQVIPINDTRAFLEKSMDSKAYIMGLK